MFDRLLSVPKSFYASWRLCSFRQAFSFPVVVHHRCVLRSLKGRVVPGRPGARLQVGFGDVTIFDRRFSRSIIDIKGTVELEGSAHFGHGARICVGESGRLILGDRFSANAEGTIVCMERVETGRDVLMGWNSMILDSDFHSLTDVQTGRILPEKAPVMIGDRVWLCARSMVLKGCSVPDRCIVSAGSVVNRSTPFEESAVVGGNPAAVLKKGVFRT